MAVGVGVSFALADLRVVRVRMPLFPGRMCVTMPLMARAFIDMGMDVPVVFRFALWMRVLRRFSRPGGVWVSVSCFPR